MAQGARVATSESEGPPSNRLRRLTPPQGGSGSCFLMTNDCERSELREPYSPMSPLYIRSRSSRDPNLMTIFPPPRAP